MKCVGSIAWFNVLVNHDGFAGKNSVYPCLLLKILLKFYSLLKKMGNQQATLCFMVSF